MTERRVIDKTVLRRAIARSTRDSAALEQRVIPAGYVRSEQVEQYLAVSRPQA